MQTATATLVLRLTSVDRAVSFAVRTTATFHERNVIVISPQLAVSINIARRETYSTTGTEEASGFDDARVCSWAVATTGGGLAFDAMSG